MIAPINDGGPAFPAIGSETFPNDPQGMSLRDWFAGQEQLCDFNNPEALIPASAGNALAGEPMPEGGFSKDIIGTLKWEAKWRAALRYIRADAMIAASEKGGTK